MFQLEFNKCFTPNIVIMYEIITLYENKRGCGYRKKGGMYLMGGKLAQPCGKLPFELKVCPCCGAGVKFSRGFTWVSKELVINQQCASKENCLNCVPFDGSVDRMGLMWVGKKFYPTSYDFIREARGYGISKRIPNVPRDLVLGKTWVLLAHTKSIFRNNEFFPGVFQAFIPEYMDYVVKGTESEDELQSLHERGFRLVDVKKATQAQTSLLTEN